MSIRLNKIIREFNVGIGTIVDFLREKGFEVNASPSEKITDEQYEILKKEFGADKDLRKEAEKLILGHQGKEKKAPAPQKTQEPEVIKTEIPADIMPKIKTVGKIDIEAKPEPAKKQEKAEQKPAEETKAAAAAATAVEKPKAGKNNKESQPATEKKAEPAQQQEETKLPEAKAGEEKQPATDTGKEAGSPEKEKEGTKNSAPETKAEKANEQQASANDTAEKKADAIGTVKDGIFQLHPQVELSTPKVLGTIDLSSINQSMRPKKKTKEEKRKEREEKNKQNAAATQGGQRKKRNRIGKERVDVNAVGQQVNSNGGARQQDSRNQQRNANNDAKRQKGKIRKLQPLKPDVSDEDVAKQVKETLARLTSKGKDSRGAKYRREKRENARLNAEEAASEMASQSKILKLTEFVTANELAAMMNVPVNQIIATCMSIGIMVSINQRMDAETIDIVAEEFGYKTEYVSAEVSEAIAEEEDNEEDLVPRAPIVTVMGHVDHGKTSLLDYIRKTNVIAGEAGGITQHIGAYNVTLENGRHITFLDTPGHEAFTAMRARGAKATDIAIIVVAADDGIMPQTVEAINHAKAAGVSIIVAINKIDKPAANIDAVKTELTKYDLVPEEWGGDVICVPVSALTGKGIPDLLESVLLIAEVKELKANPNRRAKGLVIEAKLDRGRGPVATVLVQNGTLHDGDTVICGTAVGRVRAMMDERGKLVKVAGPSVPVEITGLDAVPSSGDEFNVVEDERMARQLADKRRAKEKDDVFKANAKVNLDELFAQIKEGVKDLNIIVKADVKGSAEAVKSSLEKLSNEEVRVNVIHVGVGGITENDVMLASASNAIIVGFNVRPDKAAMDSAEAQGVDIRTYRIIYECIEEITAAIKGMLKPIYKESVLGHAEVRQTIHVPNVGTIAGSYVTDGKITRASLIRVVRDGVVIFEDKISSLRRFKDDVKEVASGYECGVGLEKFNDIKEKDILEAYIMEEVERT